MKLIDIKTYICSAFGMVGSTIAYLLGGFDEAIITLLIFMGVDYITGLLVAGVFHKSKKSENGALESKAGWKGLIKKCVVFLFIIIANRLDMQIGASYIKDAVCISFIVNELISIIENACLMGLPIPKVLTKAIEILREKEDTKDETGNR